LRWRRFDGGATIGIDMDGYSILRSRNSPPHIACIKGVLRDAVRFETGATRASMVLQAWLLPVCRFYPRKRLNVLLRAAALLRQTIPNLEIRIVGNGPEYRKLQRVWV
jgi:glycosyltransferase involved in cell wall biosynthesis